jgi:hypothetical protein
MDRRDNQRSGALVEGESLVVTSSVSIVLTAFEWSRVRVESGLDDSCLTRHTHNAKCCAALDTIAVRLQQRAAPPLQPRPSPICMVQQCTEQNIHRSLQMDPILNRLCSSTNAQPIQKQRDRNETASVFTWRGGRAPLVEWQQCHQPAQPAAPRDGLQARFPRHCSSICWRNTESNSSNGSSNSSMKTTRQ